jgi:drug/metabolite transporter (DMT)-like permease
MSRRRTIRFAIGALLLACLGEAVGFPLMKAFGLRAGLVAPGVSGWFMSACLLSGRFLFAALLLAIFQRKMPRRSELVQGAWLGTFACAGHLLQTDGLSFTDASTSAFLTQGYVVVLPLLAAVETRRLPERRVLWAVAVSLVGLAILARFDPWQLTLGRGEAETLLAAVFFAGQIFVIGRPGYAHNRTGPVTLVMFLTVGFGALPLAAANGRPFDSARLVGSGELWWLLAGLTVLSTLLPFVLMNRYQRHVSSSEAGVIYGAEPVLASLLALFLPNLLTPLAGVVYVNETLSLRLVVGALLVTLSPVLLRAAADSSDGAPTFEA